MKSQNLKFFIPVILSAFLTLFFAGCKIHPVNAELIKSYTKLECHFYDKMNYCPSNVTVDDTTKFSSYTIFGVIAHAVLYIYNVYPAPDEEVKVDNSGNPILKHQTCEKFNATELSEHNPVFAPSDSTQFVIDMNSVYDCVGSIIEGGSTRYVMYSKAEDEKTFAVLFSQKEKTNLRYNSINSGITQAYLRFGDSTILALNLLGVWKYKEKNETGGKRSIGIFNATSNKFIIKYMKPNFSIYKDYKDSHIIALGTGGYEPGTGTWAEGYYMIKVYNGGHSQHGKSSGAETVCVKNAQIPVFVDASNCSDVSGFFSETGWTNEEVHQWLGTSKEDQTNLAGFNVFFDNSEFMTVDDVPLNTTDYFPDSIAN